MGIRWFNFIGFGMLFLALFLNEVVYLNVWYESNFFLVFVAAVYFGVALWLSLWGGSRPQEA
ncbi:MAG: hypothetical protein AB7L09_08435 [Nitrospira sp.]